VHTIQNVAITGYLGQHVFLQIFTLPFNKVMHSFYCYCLENWSVSWKLFPSEYFQRVVQVMRVLFFAFFSDTNPFFYIFRQRRPNTLMENFPVKLWLLLRKMWL